MTVPMVEWGYVACPDRRVKLAIGHAVRDEGVITGFEYPALAPAAVPSRRIFLQALSRLLADSPSTGLSLHLESSPALADLREIGRPTEQRGIPWEEYLHDQPPEWVTYFAKVWNGYPRANPTAVLRRREISGEVGVHTGSPQLEDEIFGRKLRWVTTWYLHKYWIGHDDIEHVEISEGEVVRFVLRALVDDLPLVVPE